MRELVAEACPRRKRTHSLESNVHSDTDFTDVTSKKSKHAHLKLQLYKLLENSQCATQCKCKTSKPCENDNNTPLCVLGAEPASSPESVVQCCYCSEFYHLACCAPDMTPAAYTDILKLTSFMGWTCRASRPRLPSLISMNQLRN